jgi:hypothetical protein
MLYVVVSISKNEITKPQMYQIMLSVRQILAKKKKKNLKRYDNAFMQDFFPFSLRFLVRIA